MGGAMCELGISQVDMLGLCAQQQQDPRLRSKSEWRSWEQLTLAGTQCVPMASSGRYFWKSRFWHSKSLEQWFVTGGDLAPQGIFSDV